MSIQILFSLFIFFLCLKDGFYPTTTQTNTDFTRRDFGVFWFFNYILKHKIENWVGVYTLTPHAHTQGTNTQQNLHYQHYNIISNICFFPLCVASIICLCGSLFVFCIQLQTNPAICNFVFVFCLSSNGMRRKIAKNDDACIKRAVGLIGQLDSTK